MISIHYVEIITIEIDRLMSRRGEGGGLLYLVDIDETLPTLSLRLIPE